jgi:hypothetical protein
VYRGLPRRRAPRRGRRVGTGRRPPCLDTFPPAPGPPPKGSPVALRRIKAVPPALGVYAFGRVYVADGFFPALPSHPLHRSFYGPRPGVPNATLGARCPHLRTVRGVVADTTFGLDINQAGSRGALTIVVDAWSGISGYTKAGHPYLERGDSIKVFGWGCKDPRSEPPRFLVARRIRPQG